MCRLGTRHDREAAHGYLLAGSNNFCQSELYSVTVSYTNPNRASQMILLGKNEILVLAEARK